MVLLMQQPLVVVIDGDGDGDVISNDVYVYIKLRA